MREGIITVDVGTSSIRVSLFSLNGERIIYNVRDALAGERFCATAYFDSILALIGEVTKQHPEYTVVRLCVSTLISWVFIDREGNAVSDVFTFMDLCPKEATEFTLTYGDTDVFYKTTGRNVTPELAGLKFVALKRRDRTTYGVAAKLLSFKDYINLRFTGVEAMDYTFAAFTMLSDIRKRCWDSTILSALSIDSHKLPTLCFGSDIIGPVRADMYRETGLCKDTLVVCGGSDGTVGVLGSGIFESGVAIDVMGTTDSFYQIVDQPVFDKQRRLITHSHVVEGLWLSGGPTGLTGGALSYMARQFDSKEDWGQHDEGIINTAPGADGLKIICAFAGERTPRWRDDMRGVFWGVRLEHGSAHFLRGCAEAAAYLMRELCECIEAASMPIKRIAAIGGGAKSNAVLQIRSNVTGKVFNRLLDGEATTRGCYALAMRSLKYTLSEININKPDETVVPDIVAMRTYNRLYTEYMAFYQIVSQNFC